MADQNINNMTVIWNSGGTTFSAVKMNVTDTASAAASLLLQFQVGGSDKFKVGKDGTITGAGNLSIAGNGTISGNLTVSGTLTASGITGAVTGPASSTDNAIARFNGTGGGVIQNSGIIVDDSNNLTLGGILRSTGANPAIYIGGGDTSTGTASIEIGQSRTANGAAVIDLHGQTGTDYDARIIRNGGANGSLQIVNNGSGGIALTGNTTITGTLAASGDFSAAAGTFSAAVSGTTGTFSGSVTSSSSFLSSGVNAFLANNGSSGGVYLRPNGVGSTSGQLLVASSGATSINGNTTINGTLTVTG
jgi:hypothetical protein